MVNNLCNGPHPYSILICPGTPKIFLLVLALLKYFDMFMHPLQQGVELAVPETNSCGPLAKTWPVTRFSKGRVRVMWRLLELGSRKIEVAAKIACVDLFFLAISIISG